RRLRVLCTNIYLLPAREHRPDLHAFPTRRSSDLAVMNAGRLEQADSPWALYNRPRTRFVAEFIGRTNLVEGVMQDDHIRCDGFRSEEHTSELQSREKIVCRILLENKKRKQEGPGN